MESTSTIARVLLEYWLSAGWHAPLMSVAVCFSGYHRVRAAGHGTNIRQHLIEPLNGTTLMALNYRDDDGCSTLATCSVQERFRGLGPIAKMSFELQPTLYDLVETIEALPHWPAVLTAFNTSRGKHRGGCTRDPHWSSSPLRNNTTPYSCARLDHVQGNTIFAPVLVRPRPLVPRLSPTPHATPAEDYLPCHLPQPRHTTD